MSTPHPSALCFLTFGLAALLVTSGCGLFSSGAPNETVLLNSLELVVNGAAGAIEAIALQDPGPDAAKASLYAQQLTTAIDASITEFQTTDALQVKIATALGDFGSVVVPDLPAGPAQVIIATLIPTVETLLKQLSAMQISVAKAPATHVLMSAAGTVRLTAMQHKNHFASARAKAVHAAAAQ